jgi:hypothetical protein
MLHSCALVVVWAVATALLCVYHVARGAATYKGIIELQRKAQEKQATFESNVVNVYPERCQRVLFVYVHDALLHTCATIFGSLCLFGAANIAFGTAPLMSLNTESAILMVSLGLLGVAGITGQLALILASGQLPLLKS